MSGRVTSVAVRGDAYRRTMRLVEVGGRLIELHIRRSPRVRWHRISFRAGEPPELAVRPRASEADILAAIEYHAPWLERQLANAPEPQLGLDRLTLTEAQGRREAIARISLVAQSEALALGVRYTRHHAARPAQPLGLVLEQGNAELQLAARARAARRPRLRRRARGLPPRRAASRARRSGSSSRSAGRTTAESKQWLDEHGWEILAYRPPEEVAA